MILICYYFDHLRYQKVSVAVHGDNEASLRLHDKLGFAREGVFRRHVYTNGEYVDLVWFGMTSERCKKVPGIGNPPLKQVKGDRSRLAEPDLSGFHLVSRCISITGHADGPFCSGHEPLTVLNSPYPTMRVSSTQQQATDRPALRAMQGRIRRWIGRSWAPRPDAHCGG